MTRKRNSVGRSKRFLAFRRRCLTVVPIVALLLSSCLTVSHADAIEKIRLGPKPELSTGSTTGDGISVTVSNLRTAEVGSDLVNLKWLGSNDVYRIVHIELTNHSDATYYPNIVDFQMLATDAVLYASFAAFPSARGFPNGKGTLAPGESAAADLAFPMPRSKSPAAVVWGTPNLVGGGRILAPTLGTRVILIPDANGRPVATLKPSGATGAVTQFGVTVNLEKAHVVDLPASVRYRVPEGYVVETIHGTTSYRSTRSDFPPHTNSKRTRSRWIHAM
jgi:hypothetical protein